MLSEGDTAPDFELEADGGTLVRLRELKGAPVVLYFYPKDDTSGCTREAIDFTAMSGRFTKHGAHIIGVSPDSVTSHNKFKTNHKLKVQLVADTEKLAAQAYGVWVSKSMYGRKYMGVERSTFLLDAEGKIARIWRKVRVPGHVDEVFEAVQALDRTN